MCVCGEGGFLNLTNLLICLWRVISIYSDEYKADGEGARWPTLSPRRNRGSGTVHHTSTVHRVSETTACGIWLMSLYCF